MKTIAVSLSQTARSKYSKAAAMVLAKMSATVEAANPGRNTPGTFSNQSCYGAVAHRLRNDPNPKWFILLFQAGTDAAKIAHACLYDDFGRKVVDTFGGSPVSTDGVVSYQLPEGEATDYPLAACLTVKTFFRHFPT